MARLYAQLFTLVFVIVTVGGLALGDASHVTDAHAGGNLAGLTLHMTWGRDVLDGVLLVGLALAGFVAPRNLGAALVVAVGAVLAALGVYGFVVGDDAMATRGFADLHFPTAVNVFDLVVGLLALLSGGVTLADQPEPVVQRRVL
jgi:hypothetical protein